MNDKKRIKLNIFSSIFFKIIILILGLFSTKFILKDFGESINGVLALFTSIVGFLSIVELGIGNAISFSMYKPILEEDYDKLSALYNMFKRLFRFVMIIVSLIGILVVFLIPMLAKDYNSNYNIQISYLIFLLSVMLTYTFAHKTSMINAFKNNYITTLIHSIIKVSEVLIQILVIILTKNFYLFLAVRVIMVMIDYCITTVIFNKFYKKYLTENRYIEKLEEKKIATNILSLFLIHMGAILVVSTDSIIISYFLGVEELGIYNLYSVIISSMSTVLSLVFVEITSIMGHRNIKSNYEERHNMFKNIHVLNFMLGFIFFLGFFSIANNLVEVLFGSDYDYNIYLVMTITLTFFTDFIRRSVALYKNSLGLFRQEVLRPILEGLLNLILSLILVRFFGLYGILIATIVTRLLILFVIESHIVFKYGFNRNAVKFIFIQYLTVVLFIISMLIISIFKVTDYSPFICLIINGFLSVIYTIILFVVLTITYKPFKQGLLFYIKAINKNIENI